MPAFLTHWYILMETARRSEDAGGDLGSLIVDTSALRRRLSGLHSTADDSRRRCLAYRPASGYQL